MWALSERISTCVLNTWWLRTSRHTIICILSCWRGIQGSAVLYKIGVRVSAHAEAKITLFYIFTDFRWPLEKQLTPEKVKWCCNREIFIFSGALLTSKSPGCGFCIPMGFRKTGGVLIAPDVCGGGGLGVLLQDTFHSCSAYSFSTPYLINSSVLWFLGLERGILVLGSS